MGLFGGSKEKREQKALEHFLASPSIDSVHVDELKRESRDAAALLHGVVTQSKNSDHRFRALVGLNMLGITPAMVPAVIAALTDPDDFVQESAAKIISTHRQFADSFIPALLAAYREHPASRPLVLHALCEYGAAAREAAQAILADLWRPADALAIARCLSQMEAPGLDPITQSLVDVLADKRKGAELKSMGAGLQSAFETFLLLCVPWKCVDAIPAWRRVFEAYAELCDHPAPALLPVLTELTQFTDWKLRGETGDQYLEMSRAKMIAEDLLKRTGV
jgi:hypothetical protein